MKIIDDKYHDFERGFTDTELRLYNDVPIIGQLSERVYIGTPFLCGGKVYSASCIIPKDNIAFVKELDINYDAEELYGESNIKCPYCGCENHDSWEVSSDDDIKCDDCGGEYHYERVVSVDYSMTPLTKPTVGGKG